MNSRVHPKYKTKYRVTNWAEYDQALVQRGDITLWIASDAIKAWGAKPSGRQGAPRKYTDLAIETALSLRLVFRLPLRQAEGFLRSLFDLMDLRLEAPDHTTLYGGRAKRGWRKLHIGVDRMGMIRAQVLTESSGDDARTGLKVIKKTSGKLASVTGDAAYDTVAIYDQAGSRGARVVVPPT